MFFCFRYSNYLLLKFCSQAAQERRWLYLGQHLFCVIGFPQTPVIAGVTEEGSQNQRHSSIGHIHPGSSAFICGLRVGNSRAMQFSAWMAQASMS